MKNKIIDIFEVTQECIAYHPDKANKLKYIIEEALKNERKIILDFRRIREAYFGFLDIFIGYFVKSYKIKTKVCKICTGRNNNL